MINNDFAYITFNADGPDVKELHGYPLDFKNWTEQEYKDYFKRMSSNFKKEYGHAVKELRVGIAETGGYDLDKYTGITPEYNEENPELNKHLWYKIIFEDGDTGWLRWNAYSSAAVAVYYAVYPLDYLAAFPFSRGCGRAAVDACIAAKNSNI